MIKIIRTEELGEPELVKLIELQRRLQAPTLEAAINFLCEDADERIDSGDIVVHEIDWKYEVQKANIGKPTPIVKYEFNLSKNRRGKHP